MDPITIVSNNVPRPILRDYELTPAERAEFDYLDWASIEAGRDSASFARYRGELYDLGEFQSPRGLPTDSPLTCWDGYQSDSYFSAVLIRYASAEEVILGRYYC